MLSKLWQNVVMTSAVEFYCLPCESYLRSSSDAELHIAKPVHRKALDATPYAEGRKDDRIRQVSNGYYCEFCNLLFPTSSKVGLHVADPSHLSTKGNQLLKRDGTSVIAFNKVSITEKTWNGFRGKTCVVCSKDFVFENIHKSEKEHIIRLIQSKIEYGEDGSIYRKIDDGYIQCLTCNEEFLQKTCDAHFSSAEHLNKYEESKTSITNAHLEENENHTKGQENHIAENSSNTDKPKEEIQKEGKPKEEVKKETVKPKEIKKPKDEVKKTVNAKNVSNDKTTESQDPYDTDKKFREVLNADEYVSNLDNQFCILCEVDVKESKGMHIASRHHQKLLKLHKDRLAKMKTNNVNTVNESNDNASSVVNESVKDSAAEQEKEPRKESHDVDDNNNKDKILESVNELTKDGININFETLMATCKSCKKDLEFDYDIIKNHIDEHKAKKSPKFDWNESKDEAKNTTLFTKPVTMKKEEANGEEGNQNKEVYEFAKRNCLEFKGDFYACNICGVHLTASLKQLKSHINGKAHKNRLQRHYRQVAPERAVVAFVNKVPMKDFIKEFTTIENIGFKDIVINFKYCVNILSFFMYTKHAGRLRCQLCKVNLTMDDVNLHKMENGHHEKMQNTMVITSIVDEFIREVQKNVLHCGYCNLAVDESDMANHLLSTTHKEFKRSMQSRLHQYLPVIRERRQQQTGMQMLFAHLLARAVNFGQDSSDDEMGF